MAFRLTTLVLHSIVLIMALVIGLTALYNPSNIYAVPSQSVWLTLLIFFSILTIVSTVFQLKRPSGAALVLSMLGLVALFFFIPVATAFIEYFLNL